MYLRNRNLRYRNFAGRTVCRAGHLHYLAASAEFSAREAIAYSGARNDPRLVCR